jgi:hypothetical protein
MSGAP